ncbi:ABC transporter ATP-binding protein [Mumia zhuanghuii]|uniref:ATP-binding cassette domain-containing protein n=1 Tax=Mumia zhuanghuii TaxID=2585211 RepID=A0A5C4MI55_9ACTN|nr:oligopeptide/dipeptide ABC transporter ATP-binding protein [Mumia zhuanghuii]TNC41311.1 ATP-binding cassette domain-containing protein [Mumia zhuanghuii]TNC50906.1 ATP-binding cassette domain-containing protein [Mumia zhuanghuii]
MTDTDVVLEVRDLAKTYPVRRGVVVKREVATVRAVDGVSLTLRRGRTLGLVGESGSGKSTLAKMLVGIEKPSRGEILVDGVDVTDLGRADRRRLRGTIQMVFQDPYTSLNPRMSVGEIVGEAFAIHPGAVPPGGRDKAVHELLDRVGLNPDHVSRYPHQFSGGQRQRIGIARALAVSPRILICDEPVSALDVSIQGQVINLLEELQDDLGLSYLFIAHDLSVVRHIADEVAVMYLGRLVETGQDAEVYDHASHPYTRALMSAVPVPDPTRRDRPEIVLEGDMPSPSKPPSGCHFHTRCWLAPTLADAVTDETRPDGARVPSVCRHDSPKLAPQESPDHLAACHFASDAARR